MESNENEAYQQGQEDGISMEDEAPKPKANPITQETFMSQEGHPSRMCDNPNEANQVNADSDNNAANVSNHIHW